jgi:DNA-binding transcriptional regulator YdaS (Cro superfamily)
VLAKRIGITPQALSQWEVVPPLRVIAVERATGVSRSELRPDLYPADEVSA